MRRRRRKEINFTLIICPGYKSLQHNISKRDKRLMKTSIGRLFSILSDFNLL